MCARVCLLSGNPGDTQGLNTSQNPINGIVVYFRYALYLSLRKIKTVFNAKGNKKKIHFPTLGIMGIKKDTFSNAENETLTLLKGGLTLTGKGSKFSTIGHCSSFNLSFNLNLPSFK